MTGERKMQKVWTFTYLASLVILQRNLGLDENMIERVLAYPYPIRPNCFKVHVDASFHKDGITPNKIAWVVYLNDELFSTHIVPVMNRNSVNGLEELAFKIVNQLYGGAKIYTDAAHVWEKWKGKNKNRIYLIDHNDNLADDLIRTKDIPKKYQKVPTYKFEYVKVKE